jgi:nitroreductase
MENMWLMAQALGIGFHVLSALSVDAVEKEVKRILAIPEHLRIGFACRLGYPISTPSKYLRVRREVKDLTHYNRFGNKKLD